MPEGIVRRPSYGAASPMVGRRGARTRQRIVDATLARFEEHGFHATLIDDVANDVGLSRATLYQYFESKEQIFFEALRDSGAALLGLVADLEPVGPTAGGLTNLHRWLGQWAFLFERYQTVYVQWAHVDSPRAPLRPLIERFVGEFSISLERQLAPADLGGLDPRDFSVALLALVSRVNYFRVTGDNRGLTDREILDALATVVQLVLFPDTPPAALAAGRPSPAGTSERTCTTSRRPEPPAAGQERERVPANRRNSTSQRVQRTIRRLLDGGATVFSTRGFHNCSVDEIAAAAGLRRGTFYKYFSDKVDLLNLLGEEAAESHAEAAERLREIPAADDPGVALRHWLAEVFALHSRYAGVSRAWIEREPTDPALQATGDAVAGRMVQVLDEVVTRTARLDGLRPHAVTLVLVALLERVPRELLSTGAGMSPDRAAGLVAQFIERGVFTALRPANRPQDATAS